ncbi:MAG TPA: tetratricopeptide repeat protein, partial [Burkholderiales bacterium]|nr:tetratricopeptide repeat protein [Burkholderiales bacterium]
GFAERVLGLSDEAAASFERALKLKPDNPPAHFNYGALLLNRGRPQAALPHFAAACRGGMPNACELERELRAPASPSR